MLKQSALVVWLLVGVLFFFLLGFHTVEHFLGEEEAHCMEAPAGHMHH